MILDSGTFYKEDKNKCCDELWWRWVWVVGDVDTGWSGKSDQSCDFSQELQEGQLCEELGKTSYSEGTTGAKALM